MTIFSESPYLKFYNLNGFETWTLTCDIDWAPDYAVEDFFSIVESFGFELTAFATHKSSLLVRTPKWLEVGLHPDYTRPHPEYGISRKLIDLKDLYPDSQGVRSHRNFFGQNTADLAKKAGLIYDCSTLLWCNAYSQIYNDQFGLRRLSYVWEDGVHADMGLDWDMSHLPTETPGVKIFNFHPIFTYLNCPNDEYRREVVKGYNHLETAPMSALKPQIYQGYGARNFLIDMLKELKRRRAQCYSLINMIKTDECGV